MVALNAARTLVKESLLGMESQMNALGRVFSRDRNPQRRLVIIDELEYEFGWVFCYNTKQYIETGDTSYALVGNAPLIVDRANSELYVTGTSSEKRPPS